MTLDTQNTARRLFRMALGTERGIVQRYLFGAPSIFAILSLLILPGLASGQDRPEPPPVLCVDGTANCASSGDGADDYKKWNPGHYLKTQGNHSAANKADYVSSMTRAIARTSDSTEILGAHITYSWGMIEPTLGNYDWEPIRTHLDELSSRGKKMILIIEVKCFSTDCTNLAPSDLASEVYVTSREYPTTVIEIWEEQNMNLYIKLWQALAAEFDGHPDLEIVMGSESSASLQGDTPVNYSRAEYSRQLRRMYSAKADAFKATNVIASVNYLSGEVSNLIEDAFQESVGRGLSDIEESVGSVLFRGECEDKDCGVRDYRGLVPHYGIVSSPSLSGHFGPMADSPAEVIAYGRANDFTHYAWVSAESGEDSWSEIIAEIESAASSVYVACPDQYKGRCN